MSEETQAMILRRVARYAAHESDAATLERVAAQLDSDAKRFADSEKLQEIGKSAMSSIADMVAALDCDYERLEELKEERDDIDGQGEALSAWYADNGEEIQELMEEAGECKDREEAERRIMEDALSVEVRSPWYEPGKSAGEIPEEFNILLSTGGPATRIIGELNEHGEPTRARLQAQDWGTVWTDYVGADMDTLLTYCRCFYFGEG